MNEDKIALQLYTVRELAGRDMLGTLRQIAAQGYRVVEFAGYGDSSVEQLRALLDELGVRAIAAHVGLDKLQAEPEQTLTELRTLGCAFAVVPSIGKERLGSPEQVRQLASEFNRVAETCKEAGLRFAYHNHAFEFEPLDGSTIFDLLVEMTDPALVGFEFDLYWARYGGVDEVATLRRLTGRVPLLHAKDMAAGEERVDAPVGEGVLRWSDILREGAAAGVEWYIVEQDNPRDPLADVERSLHSLRRMLQ